MYDHFNLLLSSKPELDQQQCHEDDIWTIDFDARSRDVSYNISFYIPGQKTKC